MPASPIPAAEIPFGRSLFGKGGNRAYLYIALIGIPAWIVLFKACYPFADYMTDSYTYIDVAVNHTPISYRPVGYSRLLYWLHALNTSDTFLFCFQYVLLQTAGLFFFFSIRYFFPLNRIFSGILFAFLVFNPVSLILSNLVMSDAVFTALSLIWLAQLLWIINRPAWYHVIIQAILLGMIFSLRYTAIYYPLVGGVAFLLSRRNWLFKTAGIGIGLLTVWGEMKVTTRATAAYTGTKVFSGFSGWQIANNALHMYPYINDPDSAALPPPEFAQLDYFVKRYFAKAALSIKSTP